MWVFTSSQAVSISQRSWESAASSAASAVSGSKSVVTRYGFQPRPAGGRPVPASSIHPGSSPHPGRCRQTGSAMSRASVTTAVSIRASAPPLSFAATPHMTIFPRSSLSGIPSRLPQHYAPGSRLGPAIPPCQMLVAGDFLNGIRPLRSYAGASGDTRRLAYDRKNLRCRAMRPPVVSYIVHGSTVFSPAASNGAVSRVATIMPLAAAVAAM